MNEYDEAFRHLMNMVSHCETLIAMIENPKGRPWVYPFVTEDLKKAHEFIMSQMEKR
jgi:hypothetical protein